MKNYGRYSQAYKLAAVSTVDQRKLIIMLYDGAIKFLTIGIDRINKGDNYEAHKSLIRGKSIIAELLAVERGKQPIPLRMLKGRHSEAKAPSRASAEQAEGEPGW